MTKQQKRQLDECLSTLSLRELPEKWDKKSFYLMAVVEVYKSDGTISYALQRRRANKELELFIAKDFGSVATIMEIRNVYPFVFLKEQYVFQGKKEEKIKFLKSRFPNVNFEEMELKEMKNYIFLAAIESQIQQENL